MHLVVNTTIYWIKGAHSLLCLAGAAVGLKNWLRITFAVDPAALEDGLERMKAFYLRHAKKQGEADEDQIVSL